MKKGKTNVTIQINGFGQLKQYSSKLLVKMGKQQINNVKRSVSQRAVTKSLLIEQCFNSSYDLSKTELDVSEHN